jgi:peptide-methionine (S)-S-oxide reductase
MKWIRKNAGAPSRDGLGDDALPGRNEPMQVENRHFVTGHPIQPPFPEDMQRVLFAMGCFWGAERVFWEIPGVFTTAVGYTAGITVNPTYEEVCSGRTGHTEAVLAVFDPEKTTFADLLELFWEKHDPTQGNRQGNDVGTQYRSGIYFLNEEQRELCERSKVDYDASLKSAGYGGITTEIVPAGDFFYAEDYHQQYLAKNPAGYCSLGGTGVRFSS